MSRYTEMAERLSENGCDCRCREKVELEAAALLREADGLAANERAAMRCLEDQANRIEELDAVLHEVLPFLDEALPIDYATGQKILAALKGGR